MLSLEELIVGCQKDKRKAQKELYDRYAPVLLGVCMRYAKDSSEAEDVLQSGNSVTQLFLELEFQSRGGSEVGYFPVPSQRQPDSAIAELIVNTIKTKKAVYLKRGDR